MNKDLIKLIIRAEYAFAAVLVAAFFITVAFFDWWWLLIWFLVFDISTLGYLINKKIGALTYNIGHSLIGPTCLIALYIVTFSQTLLFIILLWLFHIFVDRAMGYGLKHSTGFHHTHLGTIGKPTDKV
jgi:hypothetical protein